MCSSDLALGICNGFQALIKLGLVPYGEFKPLTDTAPTLTFNTIGRHLSRFVTTKVVSTKSPWFSLCKPGDLYSIAISHGEGRFIASDEQIKALAANGQIATQYTDLEGNPTYDSSFNPNGSSWAVEGSARHSSARPSSARPSSVRPSSVRRSSVRRSSAPPSSVRRSRLMPASGRMTLPGRAAARRMPAAARRRPPRPRPASTAARRKRPKSRRRKRASAAGCSFCSSCWPSWPDCI